MAIDGFECAFLSSFLARKFCNAVKSNLICNRPTGPWWVYVLAGWRFSISVSILRYYMVAFSIWMDPITFAGSNNNKSTESIIRISHVGSMKSIQCIRNVYIGGFMNLCTHSNTPTTHTHTHAQRNISCKLSSRNNRAPFCMQGFEPHSVLFHSHRHVFLILFNGQTVQVSVLSLGEFVRMFGCEWMNDCVYIT